MLYLGQMLMVPTMRDTLAVIADEQHLGAHFGMLSTIGGILALAGTVGIGYLFDHAATAVPWLAAAAVTAVVTLLTWWWSRSIDFWWPLPR